MSSFIFLAYCDESMDVSIIKFYINGNIRGNILARAQFTDGEQERN